MSSFRPATQAPPSPGAAATAMSGETEPDAGALFSDEGHADETTTASRAASPEGRAACKRKAGAPPDAAAEQQRALRRRGPPATPARPRRAADGEGAAPAARPPLSPARERTELPTEEERRATHATIREMSGCCDELPPGEVPPCEPCKYFYMSQDPEATIVFVGAAGRGKTSAWQETGLPREADVPGAVPDDMPGTSGSGATALTKLQAASLVYAAPGERARLVVRRGVDGPQVGEPRVCPAGVEGVEALRWLRDAMAEVEEDQLTGADAEPRVPGSAAAAAGSGPGQLNLAVELHFCWGTGPGVVLRDTPGFVSGGASVSRKIQAADANVVLLFEARAATGDSFTRLFGQVDCPWSQSPTVVSVYWPGERGRESAQQLEEAAEQMKRDLQRLRMDHTVLSKMNLGDQRHRVFANLAEDLRLRPHHRGRGLREVVAEVVGLTGDKHWRTYARMASPLALKAKRGLLGVGAGPGGAAGAPYRLRFRSDAEVRATLLHGSGRDTLRAWVANVAGMILQAMVGAAPAAAGSEAARQRRRQRAQYLRAQMAGVLDELRDKLVATLKSDLVRLLDLLEHNGAAGRSKAARERSMNEILQRTDLGRYMKGAEARLVAWADGVKAGAGLDAFVDGVLSLLE